MIVWVINLNIKEIEDNAVVLTKYLDRVDIVGYACARNSRVLDNELKDWKLA